MGARLLGAVELCKAHSAEAARCLSNSASSSNKGKQVDVLSDVANEMIVIAQLRVPSVGFRPHPLQLCLSKTQMLNCEK